MWVSIVAVASLSVAAILMADASSIMPRFGARQERDSVIIRDGDRQPVCLRRKSLKKNCNTCRPPEITTTQEPVQIVTTTTTTTAAPRQKVCIQRKKTKKNCNTCRGERGDTEGSDEMAEDLVIHPTTPGPLYPPYFYPIPPPQRPKYPPYRDLSPPPPYPPTHDKYQPPFYP